MEKRISGHTGLMALFGTPVGHSGSPAMYNFSFQHDGLDYAYMAFDVTEEEMPKVFESIRLLNMRGGNFTMPCKNIAAQLVDKLSHTHFLQFLYIMIKVLMPHHKLLLQHPVHDVLLLHHLLHELPERCPLIHQRSHIQHSDHRGVYNGS